MENKSLVRTPYYAFIIILIILQFIQLINLVANPSNNSIEKRGFQINVNIIDENVVLEWGNYGDAFEFSIEVAETTGSNGELLFSEIGKLEANYINEYRYLDKSINKNGIRYYRVIEKDIEGILSVSEIKTANFLIKEHFTSNVKVDYLNNISIEINSKLSGNASIQVINPMGTFDIQRNYEVMEGFNRFNIFIEDGQNNDPYIVKISLNGKTQNVLINRQKSIPDLIVVSEE